MEMATRNLHAAHEEKLEEMQHEIAARDAKVCVGFQLGLPKDAEVCGLMGWRKAHTHVLTMLTRHLYAPALQCTTVLVTSG